MSDTLPSPAPVAPTPPAPVTELPPALVLALALTPTPAPPPPDPGTSPSSGPGPGRAPSRAVLARLLVCLAVTIAFSSSHLVATADSLPFGPRRTWSLAAAEAVHQRAALLELDRPARAMAEVLGRDPGRDTVCGLARTPCGPEGDTDPDPAPATGVGTSEMAAGTPSTLGPPAPDRSTPPAAPLATAPATTATTSDPLANPVTVTLDFAAPVDTAGAVAATPATAALGAPGLGPSVDDPAEVLTAAASGPLAPPLRPVDTGHKLRLWAGGDSLGQYVGNQLLSPIADPDLTEVELDYRISTGLARPDYFDWPARIGEVAARDQPPDAIVFMVGGNDNQPMASGSDVLGAGTDAWLAEYRARVVALMDSLDAGRSHLYWIGLPPMRDQDREQLSRSINDIVATEAAARPWVTFVDIAAMFTGPDGAYASRLVGPDDVDRVARAPDGIHITYNGSTWVADAVWDAVAGRWNLTPG